MPIGVVRWETVEEGASTERVEIELTSRDGGQGRRRRRGPADAARSPNPEAVPSTGLPSTVGFDGTLTPAEAPQGGAGPLSSERRRLVVTGLAAGAVALFIGWSLGRAGGPGSAATEDEPVASTTAVSTIAPEELGGTIAPVDPSLLPTTTAFSPIVAAPPPPTTTEAPGWEVASARVDGRATELGMRIVGLRLDEVVELDTATGELASFDGLPVGRDYESPVWAGADWTVIPSPDPGREGLLFRDRDMPQPVALPPAWLLHLQHGTDRFWTLSEPARFGGRTTITEITFDGAPTGVEFEADSRYWVPGSDPAGGLVMMGAPGGTYRVAPDGTSRITTGDVIALSQQVALATDCGEAMDHCGLVVIDRATGASRPLAVTAPEPATSPMVSYYESPANYGQPGLLSAISPDGRYSPIMVSDVDQDYGVIDLTSGEFIQLGDVPESGLWWAGDSRSAVYLVNGHLMVYDFDARDVYEVSQDVFPLRSFAVRP